MVSRRQTPSLRQVRLQHISYTAAPDLSQATVRCARPRSTRLMRAMSDVSLTIAQPSPQSIAAVDRSAPLKVTGKLKRALDLMNWEGKTDSEAAVSAGMNVLSIRMALQKPHVRAYQKAQRQVLLERESPRNIHRLAAIRDKAENMPAVNSILAMERMKDDTQARSMGSVAMPGLTIQIITQSADVRAHTPQAPNVAQVIDNVESDQT